MQTLSSVHALFAMLRNFERQTFGLQTSPVDSDALTAYLCDLNQGTKASDV